MNPDPAYQIVPMTQEHVEAVAQTHYGELPTSILSRLGYLFLKDFYYKNLIHLKYFRGFVLEYENRVAGFISISFNPNLIFSELFARDPLGLVWTQTRSILSDPRVIRACFQAADFFLNPKAEPIAKGTSEVLSFAIAEPFRSLEFYKSTHLNLADELFQHGISHLKELGVKKVYLNVEKKNFFGRAFFSNIGMDEKETFEHLGLNSIRCEIEF
ncbi:MAG: hypothetical protein VYC17_01710 [Nitrospinota bacterium]|nr:hypothetical protein [Nitrospinota bacterium]